jgi:HPt (histidine-containing phosphotransfer) domain-containing protein
MNMTDSDSEEILRELRCSYMRSLADKLTRLTEALQTHNLPDANRLGHQLKGSGRSYGFPEVSEIGARIEEAASDRRLVALEAMLLELKELVQRLEQSE